MRSETTFEMSILSVLVHRAIIFDISSTNCVTVSPCKVGVVTVEFWVWVPIVTVWGVWDCLGFTL